MIKRHSPLRGSLLPTADATYLYAARLSDLQPTTIQRNVARSPTSLAPFVRIGKRTIWLTEVWLAWLADPNLRTPVTLDLSLLPARLGDAEIAALLFVSPKSVPSMRARQSGTLPPGGQNGRGWSTREVFKWFIDHMIGLPDHARIELKSVAVRIPGIISHGGQTNVPPVSHSLGEMIAAAVRGTSS